MTDSDKGGKGRKSAALKQVAATPLPGLGGPDAPTPVGSEIESLRQENAQLRRQVQQLEANFNKAIRVIAKMKEKIGNVEASLIEAEMDRDEARKEAQDILAQAQSMAQQLAELKRTAPAANDGDKAAA